MLRGVKKAVFRVLCLGALCLGGLMAEQDSKELIFSCITIYTDKDFTRAKEYFEKACELNEALTCKDLAEFCFNANDLKNALEYYSKSCKLNNVEGCSKLGGDYFLGEGVTQNFKKAFKYYSKACELNDAKGCYALAAFYNWSLL
ncbi:tetratricopeptide repeat protein [Helicobacter pylori]|uniref:tetratricopeptide repeat protein n=1 Tax=Helicobacter pylori TaxID=210 RepID=UPI000EB23602